MFANTHLWWYTARASGIVAWVLLTASVLWGLALSTRVLGRRPRPNWMLDLHRFLGGVAVIVTGAHLASLVADSWVHVGPTELLVPFTGSYRPTAVAWGVVAFYLLLAVEVTSLLRRHLSRPAWRAVHLLSFPLFVLATAHGITAGTDKGAPAVQVTALAATVAVAGLTAFRVNQVDRPPSPPARPAGRLPPPPAPAPAPAAGWPTTAADRR